MFKLPVLLDVVASTGAQRVTTWMKQFGHEMPKCTHLLGTLPTLAELRLPKPQRSCCPSGFSDAGRCFYWKDGNSVHSGRDLSSSAAYTDAFAVAMVAAWSAAVRGARERQSEW